MRLNCCLLALLAACAGSNPSPVSSAAPQIKADFHLSNEKYGELETWFGLAFAFGSLAFGLLSDQMSVRLLPGIAISSERLTTLDAAGVPQNRTWLTHVYQRRDGRWQIVAAQGTLASGNFQFHPTS